jgi:surfeit locus 1 family protein
MRETSKASFPLGLTVAVVIAFLILMGLGTWQMQRLQWKTELLAKLNHTQSLVPVSLKGLLSDPNPAWRLTRVEACEIKPETLIYMHGIVGGVSGYHALSYCQVEAGAILVELGFSAQKDQIKKGETLNLTGRLRPFETPNVFVPPNNPTKNDWYSRSVIDMSKHWGLKLNDRFFLNSANPVFGLKPTSPEANLSNRHFEYAMTWYGLGLTLLGVYGAVLFQHRARKTSKA